MYLVVSCSLNPSSRSRMLARRAFELLEEAGAAAEFVDLVDSPLPLCDGDACYAFENVQRVAALVQNADGILISSPIYNYDVSAAAKNLVELTGRAWKGKVVGFLCAAGGRSSYMSVMGLANSLMLDFRSFILPRFIYATGESFSEERLDHPEIDDRLRELTQELVRVSTALR